MEGGRGATSVPLQARRLAGLWGWPARPPEREMRLGTPGVISTTVNRVRRRPSEKSYGAVAHIRRHDVM
eukprot:scaffold536_cov98-Isochrysis_galbana.AAC.5